MKTISGEKAMPENNQVIRLKRMLNSSAFSQSEVDRTLVWLESEQATEEALSRLLRIALHRIKNKGERSFTASEDVANRADSLSRKIAYRIDQIERNPKKPIRPL